MTRVAVVLDRAVIAAAVAGEWLLNRVSPPSDRGVARAVGRAPAGEAEFDLFDGRPPEFLPAASASAGVGSAAVSHPDQPAAGQLDEIPGLRRALNVARCPECRVRIRAALDRALAAPIETSHDSGVHAAAEFFPQHRKK